jgi:hypothetical protein
MNELILVVQRIFIRASPHVSSLIEVEIHLIGGKSEDSNIKLTLTVEQRSFDVLLNNP